MPAEKKRQMFIPACGDRFTLAAAWTLTLFFEHRNIKFAVLHKLLGEDQSKSWSIYEDEPRGPGHRRPLKLKSGEITLPKGTMLEVDRVYIRTFNKGRIQEGDDYDSITFKVVVNGKPQTRQRFWVKLSSANEIEFTQGGDDLYRDRVKLVKQIMER